MKSYLYHSRRSRRSHMVLIEKFEIKFKNKNSSGNFNYTVCVAYIEKD